MQDKYCFNPNSYCPGHDNKRLAVEANASRLSDLPCSVLDKITHIEYKISLLFKGVRWIPTPGIHLSGSLECAGFSGFHPGGSLVCVRSCGDPRRWIPESNTLQGSTSVALH